MAHVRTPGPGGAWRRARRGGRPAPWRWPSSAGPPSGASEAEAGPAPQGAGLEDTEVRGVVWMWVGVAVPGGLWRWGGPGLQHADALSVYASFNQSTVYFRDKGQSIIKHYFSSYYVVDRNVYIRLGSKIIESACG